MKQWIVYLLFVMLAVPALAGDWTTNRNAAVMYYYSQNVSTNIPTEQTEIDALFIINQNGVHWKAAGSAPTVSWLNNNVDTASGWWDVHPSNPANADAPSTGWATMSRRERFLITCMYELAKLHYPSLTLTQYKAELQTIWNNTR